MFNKKVKIPFLIVLFMLASLPTKKLFSMKGPDKDDTEISVTKPAKKTTEVEEKDEAIASLKENIVKKALEFLNKIPKCIPFLTDNCIVNRFYTRELLKLEHKPTPKKAELSKYQRFTTWVKGSLNFARTKKFFSKKWFTRKKTDKVTEELIELEQKPTPLLVTNDPTPEKVKLSKYQKFVTWIKGTFNLAKAKKIFPVWINRKKAEDMQKNLEEALKTIDELKSKKKELANENDFLKIGIDKLKSSHKVKKKELTDKNKALTKAKNVLEKEKEFIKQAFEERGKNLISYDLEIQKLKDELKSKEELSNQIENIYQKLLINKPETNNAPIDEVEPKKTMRVKLERMTVRVKEIYKNIVTLVKHHSDLSKEAEINKNKLDEVIAEIKKYPEEIKEEYKKSITSKKKLNKKIIELERIFKGLQKKIEKNSEEKQKNENETLAVAQQILDATKNLNKLKRGTQPKKETLKNTN